MTTREIRKAPQNIGALQKIQQQDDFRRAVRSLLMTPLMSSTHPDFPAVRHQADRLRDWFSREAGWPLHVDRDGARLYKRPADLSDPTRGLPDYDRKRYALLCLACAVLERADAQITLRLIGERLVQQAGDPALESLGFAFTLRSASERRDLVTVCRTLLSLGVLERVAGEEDNFVHDNGWQQADALYDIQRHLLAGMLAAIRGPSTWTASETPDTTDARIEALVTGFVVDSDQGRRDAVRHHLTRRLLDDPVLYTNTLTEERLSYFTQQRGVLAARLGDATGLLAEHRAEGLALIDEGGQLTDVAMPAEGTEAHATLLVAEHLASRLRQDGLGVDLSETDIAAFLRGAIEQFGRYWRKSARVPGAEHELTQMTLLRLQRLGLLARKAGRILPLPAIARFSVGTTEVRPSADRSRTTTEHIQLNLDA